jgi:predicted lipoprotein with Yx(FWY)xxD motif
MKTLKMMISRMMSMLVVILLFTGMAFAADVGVKDKDGIGKYLADEKGMTLYLFKKDTVGTSACAGPCVEKWPLFNIEKVTVPDGVNAGDFGAIVRSDGKKQTTYKGMPLYYFFKDLKPGDTAGQGVNNVWYVVAP